METQAAGIYNKYCKLKLRNDTAVIFVKCEGAKNMEILRVERLSKIYGKGENKVEALKNVNLTVNSGEFVAIVGASGSGKSTLLHLLSGLDRPTDGKVIIDGENIALPALLDNDKVDT